MKGKEPFEVVQYEFAMHEALREGPPPDEAITNAIIESRVLHARQLCEIFLSLSKKSDNIKLEDLIPKSQQSDHLKKLIKELEETYGNREKEGSPY